MFFTEDPGVTPLYYPASSHAAHTIFVTLQSSVAFVITVLSIEGNIQHPFINHLTLNTYEKQPFNSFKFIGILPPSIEYLDVLIFHAEHRATDIQKIGRHFL